ncbi:MAG: hypothetical protein HY646_06640 [Acidobacteria bacterium]|nr:hypothetical protein [Acidobacteriota bacterium]
MSHLVQRTLEFRLLTWWHPGTGRGDGATADAVAHRGADKLPFLPGRTVKGLVRDACRVGVEAELLPEATFMELFGSPPPTANNSDAEFERVRALEAARFGTAPGSLRFSSARIGSTREDQTRWSAWARSQANDRTGVISHLYSYVASTAINEKTGTAKDHSLRTIEVVVPLTLHAFISGRDDTPWDVIGESVQLFLRGLGSHRNRGFGRADVHLVTT